MTEHGAEASKMVAFQIARGAVSDYIHRFTKGHPNATWQEMKTDLAVRFADIVDEAHARALLRTMRQKNGESLQIFAERLLSASSPQRKSFFLNLGSANKSIFIYPYEDTSFMKISGRNKDGDGIAIFLNNNHFKKIIDNWGRIKTLHLPLQDLFSRQVTSRTRWKSSKIEKHC